MNVIRNGDVVQLRPTFISAGCYGTVLFIDSERNRLFILWDDGDSNWVNVTDPDLTFPDYN